MKVLVYGPYPPSLQPGAKETVASVRQQLAAGAEVTVVSPVRSAAHRRAGLDGKGRVLLAKWIAESDAAVLHLPAVGLGNRVGQAAWSTVGLALRKCRAAVIHLAPFDGPVDVGWARLVLRHADRVVAASEANRAALVAAGLPAAAVDMAVSAGSPGPGGAAMPGTVSDPTQSVFEWEGLPESAPPRDVQAEVERQAATLRRRVSSLSPEADPQAVSAGRVMLTLPPLLPPTPTSARRGVAAVKGLVHRLTAWQVEPLVSRINELQQATVLAFEEYSRGRRPEDKVE